MKRQLIYALMGLSTIIGACRKSENLEGQKPNPSIKATTAELIKLKSGVVVEKRGG